MRNLVIVVFFIVSFAFSAPAQCKKTDFQLLDVQGRSDYFQKQLGEALKGDYSPAQKKFIEQVRDFIQPSAYDWVRIGDNLISERAKVLEKRAIRLFKRSELKIFSVRQTQGFIPQCNCNQSSWFNWTCDRCPNLNCAEVAEGCGFLGLYKCDGYCGGGEEQ